MALNDSYTCFFPELEALFMFQSGRQRSVLRSMESLDARASKLRRRRTALWIVFVMLIVLVCGLGFRSIKTATIICRADGAACSETQVAHARRLLGTPPFMTTLEPFPLYASTVRYRFPHTKEVVFTKKSIAFVVYPNADDERASYVTIDRMIIESGEKQQSIKLIDRALTQYLSSQQVPEDRYALYGTLLASVSRLTMQPLEIDIRSDSEIILSFGRNRRAILRNDAVEAQLRSLQSLLDKPTIVETMAEIDLRFSHPILRKQVFVPWHDKQFSPQLI